MRKNIQKKFDKVSNNLHIHGIKLQKSVHEAVDLFFTGAFIIADMAKNLSTKTLEKTNQIKKNIEHKEKLNQKIAKLKNVAKERIHKESCR